MAWNATSELLGMSVPGSVDTTACVPLGTVANFRDPTLGEGEFIYLPGVASTAAGNVVSYQVVYGATGPTAATVRWAGTANQGSPLAVATAATVAATFGWYQVVGAAICTISGTVAAGNPMYWQATATISATGVAGKQMLGAVATSANAVPAAGQAIVQIAWPFSQGAIT
jgi:hypothetical protein